MLELCLAPIIALSAMMPISTSNHTASMENSAAMEVMTCKSGLGAHVRTSTAGLSTIQAQYGFTTKPFGGFTFSLIPRFGAGYMDRKIRNFPDRMQYAMEIEALVCYAKICSKASIMHLSNGCHVAMYPGNAPCNRNVGEHIATVGLAYQF